MQILVTGGSGFIGSHLVESLIDIGHSVTVLDDLTTGNLQNLSQVMENSKFEFIHGSVLDQELLRDVVTKSDYIFHLAAAVGVFNIVKNPLRSMLVNIYGTENVLRISHELDTPILLTSSSEIYGKNSKISLSEDDDRILGSPSILRWSYSEAKAIDESLAMAYHFEHGLPVVIARFFNTVGPRQVGQYGMVVPRFVEMAIKNEPITIYGDGNQKRSFAHVYDVVEGLLLLAFNEKAKGRAVNIGNSDEISIIELAKMVIDRTGSKSSIKFVNYKDAYGTGFEDMERRVPNLSLIESLTGWKPRRNLIQIIDDIISFQNTKL